MSSYSALFAVALAVVSVAPVAAHFQMAVPAPIAGTAPKDPLDPSGSNFPCHGVDVSSYSGSRTSLTAGSSQRLEFNLGGGANTAVHGGGSCQLSLTYETDAAKLKLPSSWKVIHSFEGGCPSNAPGNLGYAVACTTNGGADCVNSFDFTVPSEVKAGNAILAWTWFNTIGNREMYMNCAAVTISGGSGSISSLPDMFVANLASVNTCATKERVNVKFPSPGQYVTQQKGTDGSLVYPLGVPSGCGSSGGSSSSSSATSGYSSTGVPTNTGGQFYQSTTSTSAGVSATSTSRSATSTSVTTLPTTVTSKTASATSSTKSTLSTSATSSSTSAAASPTQSSGASTCPAGQVACGSDGFYCITEKTFGLCYRGCAIPQGVSAGTKCVKQAIEYAKRSVRFPPQARRSLGRN